MTLLEYFVYILVIRYLFCWFLFNGVLLKDETSNTNPRALKHNLKSDHETCGPWPWEPGPKNLWPCNPGRQDSDTHDPGAGTLGQGIPTLRTLDLGRGKLGLATLRPTILRAGPWKLNLWQRLLVSQFADWINFNCVANFDYKNLVQLSRKLRNPSRWTKIFTKIFWYLI